MVRVRVRVSLRFGMSGSIAGERWNTRARGMGMHHYGREVDRLVLGLGVRARGTCL